MGQRTGNPRGRPPGSKNKRTIDLERKVSEVAERIAETLEDAFEGDAHALLMAVYKDRTLELPLRVDAAKAAIRYEKPALQSMSAEVDVRAKVEQVQRTIVDPKA